MENTFKSSVFGGFNRDDVIRYIEKTALESKQQIEQLEQESDALCRENAALRDELSAARGEHEKLAESYSAALELQVTLKKQLADAQNALDSLKAHHENTVKELAAFRQESECRMSEQQRAGEQALEETRSAAAASLAESERERSRLADELAGLRPQIDEYARVKTHIAEIELSARERADALDAATRSRLQTLVETCTKQCETVISALTATCASVSGELRRTDEAVSQLPDAFHALHEELDALQKLEAEP